ncbi:uncharacterized protein [Coffea arabica]|uniref:Uncharacterized protein n=1 Tax=Coffea arabica TaxID=13443 RepID=A0A6P6SPQ5_COFAR|nr:uncharacterized protein LOC113693527 isoform X1 [Coffea arabica]
MTANMMSLKAFQSPCTPNKHALLRGRDYSKRKYTNLLLCKANESDSGIPPPEGDRRKQELLARIAMLQAQKLRLTDYLDERSAYLTQFAEEANAEIDQIGENALKELDEAGSRIMENIESQMQAFEESAELNKQEIEAGDRKLADFEGQIEEDRNEGLFFKNLRQKTPPGKERAEEERMKLRELAKENAGSKTRRNIYLALIGLVLIGICDASITSSSDWRKVAVLGAILVGLLSQLLYEQMMLSETEKTEQKKSKVDKD